MATTPGIRTLKTVVFMGSAKNMLPPWGGDKRLGDRVLKHVTSALSAREGKVGDTVVKHEVTVFDPLEVFGDGGALASSGAELKAPHFFHATGSAPPEMDAMRDAIKAADAFVIVTAEYNHSLPPALSSMMGHFGGSNYAFKASGVVTYSPGPWGGARVSVALRPFLSELGCLPVSKMVGYPDPTSLFNDDGSVKDASNRLHHQLPGMLSQLEWWAVAAADMRATTGTP